VATLFSLGAPGDPVLNAYIGSVDRVQLIDGPLGSGKTTGSCQRIARLQALQRPNRYRVRPTRFLVVRNTYPDLLSSTAVTFRNFFFPEWGEKRLDEVGNELPPVKKLGQWYGGGAEPPMATFKYDLDDGTVVDSEVIFLALDRPSDVRKTLGTEYTWIFLSEFRELSKAVVDMLDGRHGRFPSAAQGFVMPTYRGMFGDSNKPDREHWYYKLSQGLDERGRRYERPKNWSFFHQPGGVEQVGVRPDGRRVFAPNPAAENIQNLLGGHAYYMDLMAGKREDWILVYCANEWGYVQEGKPVHPDFIDSVHVSETSIEADPREPLILGLDFGRTPACIVTQFNPTTGRWVALAEYYDEDRSAATFGPECKRWLERKFPGFAIQAFGDPAGDHAGDTVDESPMMILRSAGIPIEPAPTNDTVLRRAALAGPLTRGTMDGRRAFLLSGPDCPMLRKGLGGAWCFERVNKVGVVDEYKDQPAKNRWSHPCEALEYALAGGGESSRAIETPDQRRWREYPELLREQEIAEL
jgi:hypothetical protein